MKACGWLKTTQSWFDAVFDEFIKELEKLNDMKIIAITVDGVQITESEFVRKVCTEVFDETNTLENVVNWYKGLYHNQSVPEEANITLDIHLKE